MVEKDVLLQTEGVAQMLFARGHPVGPIEEGSGGEAVPLHRDQFGRGVTVAAERKEGLIACGQASPLEVDHQ